jgi:hypothetical protein
VVQTIEWDVKSEAFDIEELANQLELGHKLRLIFGDTPLRTSGANIESNHTYVKGIL